MLNGVFFGITYVMIIKVLSNEDVNENLQESLYKFEANCFGVDIERIKTDRLREHVAPTYKHILATEGERLISYLRIVKRPLLWHNQSLVLGGIGSVCTHPEYRGKGIALKLLEEAGEILKSEKVDFTLLQTNIDIGEKLYGSIGFKPVNKDCYYLNSEGERKIIKGKDVMMMPVANEKLMQAIIQDTEPFYIGEGDW